MDESYIQCPSFISFKNQLMSSIFLFAEIREKQKEIKRRKQQADFDTVSYVDSSRSIAVSEV
jgi:competence transcription factor ComK